MGVLPDQLAHVPQPIQLLLAGVGALFLTSKALSYVKFLLGVFLLSGTSVSHPENPINAYSSTSTDKIRRNSFASMASPAPGLS